MRGPLCPPLPLPPFCWHIFWLRAFRIDSLSSLFFNPFFFTGNGSTTLSRPSPPPISEDISFFMRLSPLNGVFFPPLADEEQPSSSFLIFCLQAPSIFSWKRRRGREPLSLSYSSEPRTNAHAFPEKKRFAGKKALCDTIAEKREGFAKLISFLPGKPAKACTAQHCGGIPRRRRMHSQVDRCRHSRSQTFS